MIKYEIDSKSMLFRNLTYELAIDLQKAAVEVFSGNTSKNSNDIFRDWTYLCSENDKIVEAMISELFPIYALWSVSLFFKSEYDIHTRACTCTYKKVDSQTKIRTNEILANIEINKQLKAYVDYNDEEYLKSRY